MMIDEKLFRKLEKAVRANKTKPALKILEKTGKTELSQRKGIRLLEKAIENHNATIIESILSKDIDVNFLIEESSKPLINNAIDTNSTEIVEIMLKYNADVNIKSHWNPPINHAVLNGSPEIADLLLKNGADINSRNSSGSSAISAALGSGSIDMVKVFLKNGAKIIPEDNYGNSFLHFAAQGKDVKVMEYFYSMDNKTDLKNDNGETPLHIAARFGKKDICEFLIAKGADINATDMESASPLHRAAEAGDPEIMKVLVSAGADVNMETKYGQTAAGIIEEKIFNGWPEYKKTLEYLKKSGAKTGNNSYYFETFETARNKNDYNTLIGLLEIKDMPDTLADKIINTLPAMGEYALLAILDKLNNETRIKGYWDAKNKGMLTKDLIEIAIHGAALDYRRKFQ